MIQNNTGYGSPMLGARQYPAIYSSEETDQQDNGCTNNNNSTKYTNRNEQNNYGYHLPTAAPQSQATGSDALYYCTGYAVPSGVLQFMENVQIKTENCNVERELTDSYSTIQPKEELVHSAPVLPNGTLLDCKILLFDETGQRLPTDAVDASESNVYDEPTSKRKRRPMNAFLIFCKRHRSIVSNYYKGKENRFITKVLGDWWHQLSVEQRDPFELLAKEHKRVFMSANPGFKWSTQGNMKTEPMLIDHVQSGDDRSLPIVAKTEVPDENDLRDAAAESLVKMAQGVGLPPMTTFRLADETQMGSLSKLCTATNATSNIGSTPWRPNTTEHNYFASYNALNPLDSQDIQLMHNSLGEEPCQNMRKHFLAQKRSKPEEEYIAIETSSTLTSSDASAQSAVEPLRDAAGTTPGLSRASRSCKGKRYLEFMHQNHRNSFAPFGRKTQHRRPVPSATVTSTRMSPVTGRHVSREPRHDTGTIGCETLEDNMASSFDINVKIFELPCMNLEIFLSKKKDEKKRKKPYASSSKSTLNTRGPIAAPSKNCIPPCDIIAVCSEVSPPATATPREDTVAVAPAISAFISAHTSEPIAAPILASAIAHASPSVRSSGAANPIPAPTKIVGCQKRKGLKAKITRNPYP